MNTTKNETVETRRYLFLGNTDEVTVCDCCGRADLKSTVAFEDRESGTIVHFGCVCASRALGITTKEVRAAARKADEDKRAAEQAARDAAWKAEDNRWQAFLNARRPGLDRFNQIQALGGIAAARAMYAGWCQECGGSQGVHTGWCCAGREVA